MNKVFETGNLQHTANTFLMFVVSNLVSAKTVLRDYKPEAAYEGDVVNVQFPRPFSTAHDKQPGPRLPCPLNYWTTVSFLVNPADREKAFGDITNEYIEPAAIAMAESLDRYVLFNMATQAQHRRGTPGRGFEFPGDLGQQTLIVNPGAQADLVIDARFEPTRRERDGTAWDHAALSGEQIFMDQSCPGVLITHVDENEQIGDISLMFDPEGAAIACRPLPVEGGLISAFSGLAVRVRVEEVEDGADRVTFDMLTGVVVIPELVTAIYS